MTACIRRARLLLPAFGILLAAALAWLDDPRAPVVRAALAAEDHVDADSTRLPRFEPLWKKGDLRHQHEATGVSVRDGWVYVAGGGGLDARVSKVRVVDGKVAWSVTAGSYQPSYPVSDGRMVVLGSFDGGTYRALDDATGEEKWTTSFSPGAMGSALFARDSVFMGSYNEKTCGLHCLDVATGKARWKSPTEGMIWSTPVAYGELVLVACYDGYLYAMEQATGKRAWRLDCGGRINSNPVVSGDLAFLSVDAQRAADKYDGAKQRKRFLVIDLREKRILGDWTTKGEWSLDIVTTPGQVFFSDRTELYAYDVERKTLAYRISPPAGILPYPVLVGDRLLLPIRMVQQECSIRLPESAKAPLPVSVYDRVTGRAIDSRAGNGIAVPFNQASKFVRVGDVLLVVDFSLAAYRLVTK